MALSKFDEQKHAKSVHFLSLVCQLFQNLMIGDEGRWKPVQSGIILSTTSILQLQEQLQAKTSLNLY